MLISNVFKGSVTVRGGGGMFMCLFEKSYKVKKYKRINQYVSHTHESTIPRVENLK